MDYRTVMASIERGVVAPVYLLVGEEILLRDRLVKAFQDKLLPKELADFNLDMFDGKEISPAQIANSASMIPFMSEKRVVIVQQTDVFKAKKKSAKEDAEAEVSENDNALLAYLENPNTSTCLVFTTTEGADKRKRLYKAVEKSGQVVNLDPPKGSELLEWIENHITRQGKKATKEALGFLVAAVGGNLLQMENEIAKLQAYVGERNEITLDDVQALVVQTPESTIFQLVDAVGEKKYAKGLTVLKEMIFLGEPPVRIVAMIARQFRLILQAKAMSNQGYTEKQIASQLQVMPFVAGKCLRQGRNFGEAELKAALQHMLELDLGIKTGQVDPVLGLEMALVRLCA